MGLLEKFYYNHILLRSLGWLFRIRSLTLWKRYNNINSSISPVKDTAAAAAATATATVERIREEEEEEKNSSEIQK